MKPSAPVTKILFFQLIMPSPSANTAEMILPGTGLIQQKLPNVAPTTARSEHTL
jgi:hypothetical protein